MEPVASAQAAAVSRDVASYLKYLDKEMTIMGVLAAFAMLVPALVLDRLLGAAQSTPAAEIWSRYGPAVVLGSIAFILAAFFFYRQRSLLAYYFGQISLSLTSAKYPEGNAVDFVHECDLWTSWRYYAIAFAFLSYGFVSFGLALAGPVLPKSVADRQLIVMSVGAVMWLAVCVARDRVFARFKDEYEPWAEWRKTLGARFGKGE